MGGKYKTMKKIAQYIPHKNIELYVEPFGGAGWVLLYKDKWAESEVFNDLDGNIVNLFRQVKYHPEELLNELDWLLNSREIFEYFKENPGITDIERAARYLYLVQFSFAGLRNSYNHCIIRDRGSGIMSVQANIKKIRLLHERLKNVRIERLPFYQLIDKYDKDYSFFYCDPPYYGTAGYDMINPDGFDHNLLLEKLRNII